MRRLRRLPIKVLDLYLVREFVYSYVVSVLILLSLYVVLDLFAYIDEFTEGQASTRQVIMDILSYYGYHSFLYFAQVAGMITLVAACFTLARLYHGNELTAVLAGGISLYRVALPIILMGLVFNALWIIDQELIIPRIADKLVLGHDEARGKRAFELYFLRDRDNRLLSAMKYQPETQTMEQVIVMERDKEGNFSGKISADAAVFDPAEQVWKLSRGIHDAPDTAEAFVVTGKARHQRVDQYRSDWLPSDLLLRQSIVWTWLLSTQQLSALLKKPHLIPDLGEVTAARHVRFTQPLVNILLLLLGLPFFLNREPHNVLLAVGLCLLLAILCFMLTFVSQNLASTSAYPAFTAWLPIVVFVPVATYLFQNVKT